MVSHSALSSWPKCEVETMDKTYKPQEHEKEIYPLWETGKYFQPIVTKPESKPFSIILPPPNANAPLHFGHAMYVVEDILIRYHRMKGYATLWLPGADHAGFETQVVFERYLESQGKSRFDYDRETLYKMIWDFVQTNRGVMENQLRQLGFSLDWSRMKFTLDPDIVAIVYDTFKKLYDTKLVYRAKRLVNYCVHHQTAFSDLEVEYEEKEGGLYFIKYPLVGEKGYITVATTRPETMLGDTAVAVNPKDKRYKKFVGKRVVLPLVPREIPIIEDKAVDMEFGTGAVKVTPAHDPLDFEIGEKNNLPQISVIGFDGRMTKQTSKYEGITIKEARGKILNDLRKQQLLEKEEVIIHRVGVCYKCKNLIEPLLLEQWFVKTRPLAKPALEVVKKGKLKIFPKKFEKTYNQFLENIRDWNISRQIVWGIRIPAWKCEGCNEWTVTKGDSPTSCPKCNSKKLTQDTDTFDTWFSSAQWPFATLKTTKPGDFEYFYPTTVMETAYDILRWWVVRMVMVGIFATGDIPFENVLFHGLVKDPYGKKMSKSKGNVTDPLELVEQYGADSVRMALVYGTAIGNDQSLSHPKLQAMRNFTNKIWNVARFVLSYQSLITNHPPASPKLSFGGRGQSPNSDDKWILDELNHSIDSITNHLDNFRLHDAATEIYDFIWHKFADIYIEKTKDRREEAQPILLHVLDRSLRLLHPFMPFVTETIWQIARDTKNATRDMFNEEALIIASWPKEKK
ncbi:valine--tRNA ligase [Candidatus Microgenomates bacterium]|nr:valine--tRNA ligase [Candidatus Microgenomates bacterium]